MIAQSFSAPTCGGPTAFPDALGVRRHRTANNTGRRCAAVARSIVKAILVRLGMEEWLTPRTAERLIQRWNLGAA